MRERVVQHFGASFQRDMHMAASGGLGKRLLDFAIKLIELDLFPADRRDPVRFTESGMPVYQFDVGGGWTIEFAEEEPPETSLTVIHLLALHKGT